MELYEIHSRKCNDALERLYQYIIEENLDQFRKFQLSLFPSGKASDKVDINFASSQQVVSLCKALGIPTAVPDKSKDRDHDEEDIFKDSVEEAHLKKFASDFPIIPIYLEYRKFLKACTTYGKKFAQKHINPVTGRVHSSFWPIVDTGRMASRNPNMQNIPSKPLEKGLTCFRECFTSRKNTTLLVDDYSSQESRCMADVSGDHNMITFFNEGDGDLHKYTGQLMFNVEIVKTVKDRHGNILVQGKNEDKRSLAKILNFGIPYGMSAFKLSRDFGVDLEIAQDFIDNWFDTYPSIKECFEKSFQFTLETGYVLVDQVTRRRSYGGKAYATYSETLAVINDYKRRRKKAPKQVWKKHQKAKGVLRRMSQNYIIQGLAGSMTKLAGVMLYREITSHKAEQFVKIVNIIHDEIVLEVHNDWIDRAAQWVQQSMEGAGEVFVKSVKMIAKPSITHSWEHD